MLDFSFYKNKYKDLDNEDIFLNGLIEKNKENDEFVSEEEVFKTLKS